MIETGQTWAIFYVGADNTRVLQKLHKLLIDAAFIVKKLDALNMS